MTRGGYLTHILAYYFGQQTSPENSARARFTHLFIPPLALELIPPRVRVRRERVVLRLAAARPLPEAGIAVALQMDTHLEVLLVRQVDGLVEDVVRPRGEFAEVRRQDDGVLELLRVELEDVDAIGQPRRHVAVPERLEREARHGDLRRGS